MRNNTLHRVFGLLMAGPVVFSLTGCPLFGGLSGEDQNLIKNLREVKKYVSPATNTNLNDFLRNWRYLAGFNLPAQYGMDLDNFFNLLPFGGALESVTPIPQINQTTKEISLLRDSSNTTIFQFTPAKISGNSHEYNITLAQSKYGAKGLLKVTTAGNNWKLPSQQPTTWRYGGGNYTDAPQSVSINLSGSVRSSAIHIVASLSQFSQLVPRQGNVSIQLPDLVFESSGLQFTAQGEATLTGTLGIGPSGTGEVFAANLQIKGSEIDGTLDNTKRGYNIRFKYDGSLLTAEIKSAKDQNKNLAVIDVADGGKQIVKYADGSTEDLSFAVVGSSQ